MGLYFLTTGAGHRPSEVVYDRADSAFAAAVAHADGASATTEPQRARVAVRKCLEWFLV